MSFVERDRMTLARAREVVERGSRTVHILDNEDGTFSILQHIVCEWCALCDPRDDQPEVHRASEYEECGGCRSEQLELQLDCGRLMRRGLGRCDECNGIVEHEQRAKEFSNALGGVEPSKQKAKGRTTVSLRRRDIASVLAGLRLLQRAVETREMDEAILEIASDGYEERVMTPEEIDALCEQINCG